MMTDPTPDVRHPVEGQREAAEELCPCGKPASHLQLPDDDREWACLVPNFDPATGVLLPPVGRYAPPSESPARDEEPRSLERDVDLLRAGLPVSIGHLQMTVDPTGTSITLTNAAGISMTFASLVELDAAVVAARTAATPSPVYVPVERRDEPSWCADHLEVDAEQHAEDQAVIHRSTTVEVKTDDWTFDVRLLRYDFVLLREGDAPEGVQVMLYDESLTPRQALDLGRALIAAAHEYDSSKGVHSVGTLSSGEGPHRTGFSGEGVGSTDPLTISVVPDLNGPFAWWEDEQHLAIRQGTRGETAAALRAAADRLDGAA